MAERQGVQIDSEVLFKRLEKTRANIAWVGNQTEYIEIGQYAGIDTKDDFQVERSIFFEVIGILNEYSSRIKIIIFQASLYSVNQEAILCSEDTIPEGSFEERSLTLFDGIGLPFVRNPKHLIIPFSTSELVNYRKDLDIAGFVDNDAGLINLPLNRILKIVVGLR